MENQKSAESIIPKSIFGSHYNEVYAHLAAVGSAWSYVDCSGYSGSKSGKEQEAEKVALKIKERVGIKYEGEAFYIDVPELYLDVDAFLFHPVQWTEEEKKEKDYERKNGKDVKFSELPSLLVFRGTEITEITDILTNIEIGGVQFHTNDKNKGIVQRGFYRAWHAIKPEVKKALKRNEALKDKNRKLLVTGHSMGGAMAVLAAVDFLSDKETILDIGGVYTFGQLAVGDQLFSEGTIDLLKGKLFSHVYGRDFAHALPTFRQFGEEGIEHTSTQIDLDTAFYDPKENKWSKKPSAPFGRAASPISVIIISGLDFLMKRLPANHLKALKVWVDGFIFKKTFADRLLEVLRLDVKSVTQSARLFASNFAPKLLKNTYVSMISSIASERSDDHLLAISLALDDLMILPQKKGYSFDDHSPNNYEFICRKLDEGAPAHDQNY